MNTTIRIRFTKAGKIRFVSHRDVARLFERALRKLRLPVAYSEGFSPRPKVSFGLALSVGYESDAEYLDVVLAKPVDLESLPLELSEALPNGITVEAVAALAPGSPSLQQAVSSCDWVVEITGATNAEVSDALGKVLESTELKVERERKGKISTVDVRPSILCMEVMGPTDSGIQIAVSLATESVSLRPSELVSLLNLTEGRVRRTHQWMIVDGARSEPLPGMSTRRLLESAS